MTTSVLTGKRIVFVGAGAMAEAILRGLLDQRKALPEQITMTNRQNIERLAALNSRYGVLTAQEPSAKNRAIEEADIIVAAMKPKDVVASFNELKPLLQPRQLFVSLIAGLTIAKMEQLLELPLPIVRTMPNTSSTIGLGSTGISFSSKVTQEQQRIALDMFKSVGEVGVFDEPLIEVVTGVSGSGPAYIYYMMEAMIAAGVEGGLSEDAARQLTVQTVLGAAQMVKLTQENPAELRRKVTSPNGSTQAAIEVLDQHGFAAAVRAAVHRCSERAAEMGREIGK